MQIIKILVLLKKKKMTWIFLKVNGQTNFYSLYCSTIYYSIRFSIKGSFCIFILVFDPTNTAKQANIKNDNLAEHSCKRDTQRLKQAQVQLVHIADFIEIVFQPVF